MFGALLLIVAIMAIPWVAQSVESGETSVFTVGGLSMEPVFGLENDTGVIEKFPRAQTQPAVTFNADSVWQCENGVGDLYRPHNSTVGVVGNATPLGNSYGSYIVDLGGNVATENKFDVVAGGGEDSCRMAFYYNVTKEDLLASDALSYFLDFGDGTLEWDYVEVVVHQYNLVTGVDTVPSIAIIKALDNAVYDTGQVDSIPITTTDKLLIDASFADTIPAADRLYLTIVYYTDWSDMPDEGDLIQHDFELQSERTGALDQSARLTVTNIIGIILIAGGGILALPQVELSDIIPSGKRSRMGKKGATDTGGASMVVVIGALALAIIAMWWFGGFSSLTDAFTISILPLSLAATGVALVAFSTMGQKNPGMTWVLAALTGLLGWIIGLTVQSQWLAYDKLYVVPFLDLITGNVAGTSLFQFTAALVVAAQIFAILVMAYNALSTIRSDDGLQLVR